MLSNGNTEHVYVADSHIYADNNKGRYCYDYMATMVTVRSYNESLYIHCISCSFSSGVVRLSVVLRLMTQSCAE